MLTLLAGLQVYFLLSAVVGMVVAAKYELFHVSWRSTREYRELLVQIYFKL